MKKRWIGLASAVLVFSAFLWGWFPHGLRAVHYTAENAKLTAPVRIVQLSDLHGAVFGTENSELTALVAAQEPDLIFCTGDFVTGTAADTGTAEALIASLCEIAPVWFSPGNHEPAHEKNFGSGVLRRFAAAGAHVLDGTYEDVAVAGQMLRIGGLSGYGLAAEYLASGEADPAECAFLADFQDTSACTLLLAHMPAGWLCSRGLELWDIDAVFSGHAHGGQAVLPLLGGLYAPDMGWFPGRLRGLFFTADRSRVLALTSGLGSSAPVMRIHNPPEILVLDLLPPSAAEPHL